MSSSAVDLPKAEQRLGAGKTDIVTDAARESSKSQAASGEATSSDKKPDVSTTGTQGNSRRQAQRRRRARNDEKFSYVHLVPVVLIAIAYFAMKIPADKHKFVFNWNTTQYVYAFGDDYTYVQGTAGHPKFSFIGNNPDSAFTPDQLLSDQIVPRHTSSGGSNWIEFLTGCFEGRPSDCTPRQLWNFAFAGATIDPKVLPLHNEFSVDLVDQVKQWATYAADVVPHPPNGTLTAWWIGINDTGDVHRNSSIDDWTVFWHSELRSYFNVAEFAQKKGLRGTYLFINVPPGHRQPARHTDPKGQALLQQRVKEFNNILSGYIEGFALRHRHMKVLSFDAYEWFNEVLDNADKYGFTDTTGFCQCADPTFFWYDDGHPTERVHKLLAQAIEAHLLAASA